MDILQRLDDKIKREIEKLIRYRDTYDKMGEFKVSQCYQDQIVGLQLAYDCIDELKEELNDE